MAYIEPQGTNNQNQESEKETRNELNRAVFVLGLLAVLATVDVSLKTLYVNIGDVKVNFIPMTVILLVFWSFYAFFMVFALSANVIGKSFAEGFQVLAQSMIRYSFLLFAFLTLWIGFIAYPERLPFILLLLLIPPLFILFEKISKVRSKPLKKIEIWETFKRNSSFIALLIVFASVALIMVYPDEPLSYVFTFFVIGAIAMGFYVVFYSNKLEERERV